MRYLIDRPKSVVPAVLASAIVIATVTAAVAFLGYGAEAAETCSGVQIKPGNDLDAIVNSDPGNKATTFCVQAAPSGTTYTINHTIWLKAGDKLLGQPGRVITRGPASYGVPVVKIRTGTSLEKIVELRGPSQVKWLDIAGGKIGIAAWGGGNRALMEYMTIHDTRQAGISNMHGRVLHSNLYNNGTSRKMWGVKAAAVKGITEYEAAFNYVHDNPANGVWCDVGCQNAGEAMPNGFWVHDNLIVGNGRWGVKYESSPLLRSGQHASSPTALIERNEIHGNGYRDNKTFGGASQADAQNATFRNNVFGAKTIAGVSYRANAGKRAIRFYDSGRADRTDLWNGDAIGNILGSETIVGCEKPDRVVNCSGNN